MPQRRQVNSLEELCLHAVGNLVCVLGRRLIKPIVYDQMTPTAGLQTLESTINNIKTMLLQCVPRYSYDRMCAIILFSVQKLIEETKKRYGSQPVMSLFIKEMNIVVSLTEVVITSQLRTIDLTIWPKIMRYILYKGLDKMTGLEVLNLGSCLGSWISPDKCILDGLANMSNLVSLSLCFDCNDYVIQILGENCPKLRVLDVTSSRSVTDRCIPSLLKCQYLSDLQLNRTSITIHGFAQLLLGLPYLQDLGRCDDFGSIIQQLNDLYPDMRVLNIRKFQSRLVGRGELELISKWCPNVYHVSIMYDTAINLTVLTTFNFLTELKLLSCKFYADKVNQLLEVKGYNLTLLHLEHVDQVDSNALVYISQYCPRLGNLVLYNCDLVVNFQSTGTPSYFRVKPFQHLERLFVVADCATLHLEFLLTHCINIKYIHLGASTGISHDLTAKILYQNPMSKLEELRILYSSDLNLNTVNMLLASCPNLKVLSELESWNGISYEELQSFRQHIKQNNFNLDIRPTLSY